MKVSNITNKELADYLKLEYSDLSDTQKVELDTLLSIAKAYICSYTGLSDYTNEYPIESELDEHEEFIIVVYILVQDMYDNRTLYVDKNNMNKVVETILGMHRTNMLPTPPTTVS